MVCLGSVGRPSSMSISIETLLVDVDLCKPHPRLLGDELSTRQKSKDRRVKRLRVLAVHVVGGIAYDDQLFHVVRQAEPHRSERLLETFWTLLAYDRQNGKSEFADRLACKAWSQFGAVCPFVPALDGHLARFSEMVLCMR